MPRRTLNDLAMPVNLGKRVAIDADGKLVILELYVGTPDGAVRARVADPDPPPELAGAQAGTAIS